MLTMQRSRFVATTLIGFLILCLGSSSAVGLGSQDLLWPPSEEVLIGGVRANFVDPKNCYDSTAAPVLRIKIGNSFETLAKGKLFRDELCQNSQYPYGVRYKFIFNKSLGTSRYRLHTLDTKTGEVGTSFKRTVYRSPAEYNSRIKSFFDILEKEASRGPGQLPRLRDTDVRVPQPELPRIGETPGWDGCFFRGKFMGGSVRFVETGSADFYVRPTNFGADLRVKLTSSPTGGCGSWYPTNSGGSFSVKLVNFGGDFSVQFVDLGQGR